MYCMKYLSDVTPVTNFSVFTYVVQDFIMDMMYKKFILICRLYYKAFWSEAS